MAITQFYGETIIKSISKTGATTLQLAAGSRLLVGGQGLKLDSALNCDLSTNGLGGLDVGSLAAETLYYIYAVISGASFGIVASLSSTTPSGFTAVKEIGKVFTDNISNIFDPVRYGDRFTHVAEYREGNGKGAVDTAIRKFVYELRNTGNGIISSVQAANEGLIVKALRECDIDITYADVETGGSSSNYGLSLNSTELTLGISNIIYAHRLAIATATGGSVGGANNFINVSYSGQLNTNDIVRPHSASVDDGSFGITRFSMKASAEYKDVF